MVRTMKIIAFIGFLLLIPASALAQQEVTLGALQVDIWPEYDRPGVLVIIRASISDGVQLPVDVTMRIPVDAGEPNAVAVREMDGGLFNVPYTREVRGTWALITFNTTFPEFQIEYYDSSLEKTGVNRHFVYTWPGDYTVDSFLVLVQEPTGSSNMEISPVLGNITRDNNGMVYHSSEIGALKAGESFELTIDYQKESDDLSVEFLPVQPSAPVTSATPGRVNITGLIPWGIGGLGLIIIIGGLYWYWASGKNEAPPKPRKRRAAPRQDLDESEEAVYCHQCGKRAAPGDRFCRACGTKLP